MAIAGGLLRAVQYNPCAARSHERLVDIACCIPNRDVYALIGTQVMSFGQIVNDTRAVQKTWSIEFGYKRGPLISPSCGITFLLKRSRFSRSSLKRVHDTPKQLWGRCGAITLQSGTTSLGFIGMYFPPRQTSRALRPIYEKTMKLMIDWVTGVLQDMSRRQTVPIIFTDLNGGLCKADDLVAGPFASGRESMASTLLRPVLTGWNLSAANTYFCNPPSYVGANSESYIDHICIPQELMQCVERCHVMCSAGRALLLHDTHKPHDHRPIQIAVHIQFSQRPMPARAVRPNREALF